MAKFLSVWRRHISIRNPRPVAPTSEIFGSNLLRCSSYSSSAISSREEDTKERREWVTLPPFTPQIDVSSIGKEIMGRNSMGRGEPTTTTTIALKWVRHCCPHLPMSLLQKLFRLRKVRKKVVDSKERYAETQDEEKRLRRVSAKDVMVSGDVIILPVSVQNHMTRKSDHFTNEDEIDFVRGLVVYKDPAIIVVNKPHGMPVQGGVGIKHSIDALGATSLKYDYSEPPRLVHRLDRDSSGILVLGRTQTSASILHSIFREKTSGVLFDGVKNIPRTLQRKYWALVIGTPRRSKGLISAPLAKIVLEDGKSDRITIAQDRDSPSSQHALTEYKVIRSSSQGYTWLELCPLTGRKHQLRVHCAEVLGTPIVGDYRYGWKAHRKWVPIPCSKPNIEHEKLPFGLESEGGSVYEKQPRLHLHCRQMILPNISDALQHLQSSSRDCDLSKLEMLDLVAPLPFHMKVSWDILNYDVGEFEKDY